MRSSAIEDWKWQSNSNWEQRWIGAGATILAGVTIGDNTVIGAGSLVKKDIPANVVAVGVPCKVLREITEADKDRYPR